VRCPECDVEMFVLEFERIEVDHCTRCRGVWLDSGELELIAEAAGGTPRGLASLLDRPPVAKPRRRGRRRCPVCGRRLLPVSTPGANPIVLDRCPAGDGLWFDRGELKELIGRTGADEDSPLVRFLADLARPSETPEGNPS